MVEEEKGLLVTAAATAVVVLFGGLVVMKMMMIKDDDTPLTLGVGCLRDDIAVLSIDVWLALSLVSASN